TDFHERSKYQPTSTTYGLLPFRFERFDEDRYVLTNDVGDHALLRNDEFRCLVEKSLDPNSTTYLNLRARNFVSDSRGSVHARVLASRYRTRKSFLDGFTKLHIFVISLRCDHSCPYCQVSRQSEDRLKYDMTSETARLGVDLMLRVPNQAVT